MDRIKVLVVGGYGTVGRVVSEILAADERIMPVIAGRHSEKAREFAGKLGAEWRTMDIGDAESIASALPGIGVMINCFGGPFTHTPLLLPEVAARSGIHYLDVSGSYEYSERFLGLNEAAARNDVTLMTALGANPGIAGIALMSARDDFDKLASARILFVLGARIDGISASALKELKHMFDVNPLIWRKPHWVKPEASSLKEYLGKPFEKEVYLGSSVTRDLLCIPELTGLDELSFWSGSQSTLQGLAMIAGLKLGLTRSDRGTAFLLSLLRLMGRSRSALPDVLIRLEISGMKQGIRNRQIIQIYCEENYVTALAPALVCQQIIEKKITRRGAFVPPEVVDAKDFMDRLAAFPIHYSVTREEG